MSKRRKPHADDGQTASKSVVQKGVVNVDETEHVLDKCDREYDRNPSRITHDLDNAPMNETLGDTDKQSIPSSKKNIGSKSFDTPENHRLAVAKKRDGVTRHDGHQQRSDSSKTKQRCQKERRRSPPLNKLKPVYAAIDLGTNNCRLLIASPQGRSHRVIDAFSRIVRLGEGLGVHGVLSDAAMNRTIEALKICSQKMSRRRVNRHRFVATQACRSASNCDDFLARVESETGLCFDVISPQEEARLAVKGCADLLDHNSRSAIIFDIGGGSTEVSLVNLDRTTAGNKRRHKIQSWFSLPVGVVSLSERWGGDDLNQDLYEGIVTDVRRMIAELDLPKDFEKEFRNGEGHFVGTSGTVTSIAGVFLNLDRYRREAVDGIWLTSDDVREVSERLRVMSMEERSRQACIGSERADLVVCGCAILEAIMRSWPSERIRVADRGLREGLLTSMIEEDRKRKNKRRRQTSGSMAKKKS